MESDINGHVLCTIVDTMLFVGSFIDVVHVQCYYPTVNETNDFIESVHQICS